MDRKIVSLSKDYWMPDVMAKACFKCEKPFHYFRRRHHCRYCGLLFCTNCTNMNIQLANGATLGRACEKCLAVLSTPDSKPTNDRAHYPYFPKDNSIYVEADPEDAATETFFDPSIDLKKLFMEDDLFSLASGVDQGEYAGNEEIEHYLSYRCKNYLKDVNAEDWTESLAQTIKEVVRSIKPSKKDAMNLNKYLRVVRFPVEDKCRFFKGIALKRVLANKRMSSHILNPKILVLSGSAGFFMADKKIVSMQKMIDLEENYIKIFLNLIKNMVQPNLIIIEKTMPFVIIEELANIGISVLQNVKKKVLKLISRLTSSKILSSISQSLYQNSQFMGTCVEFFQCKAGEHIYSFLAAHEESHLCGTLLFNPLNLDKKVLKEIIMKLCVQFRSIILEKNLLSLFSVNKINYEDFHSSESNFIHISICRNKICSRPKVHQIEYYSKNGRSIGDLVKYSLTTVSEKCNNGCDRTNFEHRYYYFKGKGRVKLCYGITENTFMTIQVIRECSVCGKKSPLRPLTDQAWKFSFNKFINNFFHTGLIEHETCSHQFYNSCKFVFFLAKYSLSIQYEENVQYRTFISKSYSPDIITALLHKSLDTLLNAGENLLLELRPIKDYVFKLSLNTFDEENCMDDAAVLNKSIRNIEESFNSLETTFKKIRAIRTHNYLEVNALKRTLFFPACKLIVELEGSMDLLDKMASRKGNKEQALSPIETAFVNVNGIHSLSVPFPDKFSILCDPNFLYLQEGNLLFNTADSTICVPIDENDSLSAISYALSSNDYNEDIKDCYDESKTSSERIESELLSTKDEHFEFSKTNYDDSFFNSEQAKESFRILYGDSISIKVFAYFYKQFHGMRLNCIGSHLEFLQSISRSQKEDMHLGKSKAYFKASLDERFMLKMIGERQFRMFMDFAPNYFRHICKNRFHNMPSCLVKVIGAYYVQFKNHSTGKLRQEWVLIMENLAYNLPKCSLVYDLKGTINKRRKVQEGDERTKMDLNFVEYTEGIPIILTNEDKQKLDSEIWNDTLFLAQQNIVDYSVLLIINTEDHVLRYGIIDYMEQYTFERAIESKYKTVVGTELPTIIYPKEYKNRFRQHFIQVFFMSV